MLKSWLRTSLVHRTERKHTRAQLSYKKGVMPNAVALVYRHLWPRSIQPHAKIIIVVCFYWWMMQFRSRQVPSDRRTCCSRLDAKNYWGKRTKIQTEAGSESIVREGNPAACGSKGLWWKRIFTGPVTSSRPILYSAICHYTQLIKSTVVGRVWCCDSCAERPSRRGQYANEHWLLIAWFAYRPSVALRDIAGHVIYARRPRHGVWRHRRCGSRGILEANKSDCRCSRRRRPVARPSHITHFCLSRGAHNLSTSAQHCFFIEIVIDYWGRCF